MTTTSSCVDIADNLFHFVIFHNSKHSLFKTIMENSINYSKVGTFSTKLRFKLFFKDSGYFIVARYSVISSYVVESMMLNKMSINDEGFTTSKNRAFLISTSGFWCVFFLGGGGGGGRRQSF